MEIETAVQNGAGKPKVSVSNFVKDEGPRADTSMEALAALKPAFLAATCAALLVWAVALIWVKEVPLRQSVDEITPLEASAGTPNPGPVD